MEENRSLVSEFAAPMSYMLGPVSGVFFLLFSKDKFVRFHAVQSIVVFTTLVILQILLGLIPVISRLVPLLTILMFILWLVLIYKAWLGEEWELPVLGRLSRKYSS